MYATVHCFVAEEGIPNFDFFLAIPVADTVQVATTTPTTAITTTAITAITISQSTK